MNRLLVVSVLLISVLLLFGCAGQNTPNAQSQTIQNAPQPSSTAVTGTNDALKGPVKSNATIHSLTGDKCGSYVTYNGLTDAESSQLDGCYMNKYILRAEEKADTTICDEIYNPSQYGTCYGIVAFKKSDPKICDKIENTLYERRSGHDDATTIDACRLTYIEQYITATKTVPPISCDAFTNNDFKDTCREYVGKIQPPSSIGTLYSTNENSKLKSYITLEDSNGTTQIADGKLTVELTTKDISKQKYVKELNVKKSDFHIAMVGLFKQQELIYQLPDIDLKQISLSENECPYSCDLVLKVKFETSDGKLFEKSEDYLGIYPADVAIKYDDECLLISNLKDKITDESTSYSTSKYYIITGTVTNNCDALKQSISMKYSLFDSAGVELYKNTKYLSPGSLGVGKSNNFEIKVQYDGSYKDISEIPAKYNVTIER